jgi:CrcB protein
MPAREYRSKEALTTLNLLLVALGGAIGSAARYLTGAFVANRFGPDFPWGTFIVNVSGSFFIGVILSFVGGGLLPAGARPFLAVGIMGGYTTFSTYSHETLQLIQDGELGAATFNTLGQVVAGLVAVYLGVVLGRALGGV